MDQALGAEFEEEQKPPFDPRVLLVYGVARSWFWVMLFTVMGAVLGFLAGAIQPNTYESSASFRYLPGRQERLSAEAVLTGSPEAGLGNRRYVQDEIILLRSRKIYRSVAGEFGCEEILTTPDPRRHDTPETGILVRKLHRVQAWFLERAGAEHEHVGGSEATCLEVAAKVLRDHTSFVTAPLSNVITVKLVSTSPERAQLLLSRLCTAFVDHHKEMFSPEAFRGPARETWSEAASDVEEAERAYYDHLRECGFGDIAALQVVLRESIQEDEDALFTAQTRRKEIEAELAHLREWRETLSEEIEERTATVLAPNADYSVLTGRLYRLKDDRARLPFDTLSPSRLEGLKQWYDEIILQTEEKLGQLEPRLVVKPEVIGSIPNPEYVALSVRIRDLEIEDDLLGVSIAARTARLTDKRDRLDRLVKDEPLHAALEQEKEHARAERERARSLYASLEQLAQVGEDWSNLQPFGEATLEHDKFSPKRFRLLVFGLFGGAMAGIAFAVGRQLLDTRIRYPETIESSLGVPVLAVLPARRAIRNLSA